MRKFQLHWQILAAIVLAIAAGAWSGPDSSIAGVHFYAIYQFLGELFLNALKMIIVPLVTASIITGVAQISAPEQIGRLGGKTLLFYIVSSLVAILIGLTAVNAVHPGVVDGQPLVKAAHLKIDTQSLAAAKQHIGSSGPEDIVRIFLRMVPPNIVAAAADGQMLGLIFFSLLFGYFMHHVNDDSRQVLKNFWSGVFDVMMAMTMLVMRLAPIGVFGLVAKTVATTGVDLIRPVIAFFLTVIAALAVHALIALPLAIAALGRANPLRHYRAMGPALLTAFSTASSSATLPLTMECVEKNAGVSNRTSSFVLPLGATINMDGTALYECVAAMFIAQAYGIHLGFAHQFLIVLIALLTSIGVAGVPAASLVAISIILGAVGVPLEGIGLLMVTDRILDMLRTSVNVFSDSCCAVIIARSQGETGVLQGEQA